MPAFFGTTGQATGTPTQIATAEDFPRHVRVVNLTTSDYPLAIAFGDDTPILGSFKLDSVADADGAPHAVDFVLAAGYELWFRKGGVGDSDYTVLVTPLA